VLSKPVSITSLKERIVSGQCELQFSFLLSAFSLSLHLLNCRIWKGCRGNSFSLTAFICHLKNWTKTWVWVDDQPPLVDMDTWRNPTIYSTSIDGNIYSQELATGVGSGSMQRKMKCACWPLVPKRDKTTILTHNTHIERHRKSWGELQRKKDPFLGRSSEKCSWSLKDEYDFQIWIKGHSRQKEWNRLRHGLVSSHLYVKY
jgi:hypothetical protein